MVTLDAVAAAATRCLRLPSGCVGSDVPLARLGLDSLGCVEFAAELETVLGVQLPADAVVEYATIRSLCEALSTPTSATSACDRMRADAVLPLDVVPQGPFGPRSLRAARHVLLTGATGFLGSTLLRALIERTSARVTCLVRPGHHVEPVLDSERVEIVQGDLAFPSAGLSAADWWTLTANVDAVCHVGASINWIGSYEALRQVNVFGTLALLRLACEARAAFHFISSLSVCYSTLGARRVDERHDPLATLEGLHFGYAQTKAVAESLVREAAARGLPAQIYRPSLISGDSRTGRFNPDDMLSTLIAGCVCMGSAPDLDWHLDALPVDTVADLVLELSGGTQGMLHLAHPKPRHWRECVLWMRLYGYDLRLIPYREWSAQLREVTSAVDHPLRALRSFFLDEHERGLTIPELHEEARRPVLDASSTMTVVATTDVAVAPLDAELLDTYFAAFIRESRLPAPRNVQPPPPHGRSKDRIDAAALARELLGAADVVVTPFAADHSIISELTAWHSGGPSGLFHVRAGGRAFVLKIKPHADEARGVGQSLAALCGDRLGEAYEAFGRDLGVAGGHEREVALYRDVDPVFREYLPRVVATRSDEASRVWAVLLECIADAALLDSVERLDEWKSEHVEVTVDGLAAIHAAWYGRVDELKRQSWMDHVRTPARMAAMTPLWRALADHAAPMFGEWTDVPVTAVQHRLIDRIAEWSPVLSRGPQTLIHNDFNPRNVCLRRRKDRWALCAFDWELATIGAPMRDLAEFLCFVSPADVDRDQVLALIGRHADEFGARAGVQVAEDEWQAAFAASVAELLVDRLPVYGMVHRVKPQPFLPRVLRRCLHLHALFPCDAIAC